MGTAFYEGEGMFSEIQSSGDKAGSASRILHFNNRFEADGMQFEEPVPNLFRSTTLWRLPYLRRFQPGAGY